MTSVPVPSYPSSSGAVSEYPKLPAAKNFCSAIALS